MPHELEQEQAGQRRNRQGHINLEQNLKRIRSINRRRFIQRIGNISEEVHHQDHVPDRQRAGKNHHPKAVKQPILPHQDVKWNQTAAEEHVR